MAFRVIILENESRISTKLGSLIVTRDNEDIWIPLEDISAVVIDNLKISLTTRILNSFAENNIAVIFCNLEHNPIGLFSAYDSHSRSSKMLMHQIERMRATDEIWSDIVRSKIENQRNVLFMLEIDSDRVYQDKLIKYLSNLVTGDNTNMEAHAAKEYFYCLGGDKFNRRNDDILLNSGLNYGYAIIRSFIAKLCVGTGLNTQIGLHHKNEYNRFNLVDDLMEPFRPFVDLYAYKLLKDEEYFMPEHRHKLVNLLNHKCRYRDREMYLANILEEYVEQFSKWYKDPSSKIAFPDVLDYLGE